MWLKGKTLLVHCRQSHLLLYLSVYNESVLDISGRHWIWQFTGQEEQLRKQKCNNIECVQMLQCLTTDIIKGYR